MKRNTSNIAALALIAAVVWPAAAEASFVQATFNDLSLGDLSGQSGGTGFTGNWGGNTTVDVRTGDLTAPAGVSYALTQSGTAQSIRGDSGATSNVSRTLGTVLDGTVWFSFLINQPLSTSRGGIELNPTAATTAGSGNRFIFVGDDLVLVGFGVGANLTFSDLLTLGQTSVVIGRIDIVDAGNETLTVWVDPDMGQATTPDVVLNTRDFLGVGGISRFGVESYHLSGSLGGTLDLITLSDGPGAYSNVTGLPAPAALPAGLALLGLASLRRRNR